MEINIKITLKLEKNKEIVLTQEEAKQLFYKLKEIYEPITIMYPTQPITYPTNPHPTYPIITYFAQNDIN